MWTDVTFSSHRLPICGANPLLHGEGHSPELYATWDNNHDDPRFQRHYQYADGTIAGFGPSNMSLIRKG